MVKKGDLLFEIDPRLYQAELDQAIGAVKEAQVRLDARVTSYKLVQKVFKTAAVSQEDYDKAKNQVAESQAAVHTAEAAVNVAKVRLGFTRITAPFDGRIGRTMADAGNLVTAEQTALATLMSTDPICVSFFVNQESLSAIRRNAAKEHGAATFLPVFCDLHDGKGFVHEGRLDSVESVVHGGRQIQCCALLPNQDGSLLPGMQVSVRLATSAPHKALLVPDSLLLRYGETGQRKFLFVVTDSNIIERHGVETGPLQDVGLRVVTKGITADEWIVTSDPKQLQPGMTVEPQRTDVPAAQKQ